MSILNAWVDPEYGLMGVDTQAACVAGRVGQVSKMFPLVHANAVLGFRGCATFAGACIAGLNNAGMNFDQLLKNIPAALPLMLPEIKRQFEAQGFRDLHVLDEEEVAIVGYSESEKRIRGRVWTQRTAAEGFKACQIAPYHISCWDPSLEKYGDPKTPGAMALLAGAQCKLLHDLEPQLHAGGRFIVAKVTRSGMTLAPICNLNEVPLLEKV